MSTCSTSCDLPPYLLIIWSQIIFLHYPPYFSISCYIQLQPLCYVLNDFRVNFPHYLIQLYISWYLYLFFALTLIFLCLFNYTLPSFPFWKFPSILYPPHINLPFNSQSIPLISRFPCFPISTTFFVINIFYHYSYFSLSYVTFCWTSYICIS